jgi:hypothetical protein
MLGVPLPGQEVPAGPFRTTPSVPAEIVWALEVDVVNTA